MIFESEGWVVAFMPGKVRYWLILPLLLALIFLTCCRAKVQSEEPCTVKIGVITSLTTATGGRNEGGEELLLGYELALQEINAAGGVQGCQLELVVRDDQTVPEKAQWAVKELVEVPMPTLTNSVERFQGAWARIQESGVVLTDVASLVRDEKEEQDWPQVPVIVGAYTSDAALAAAGVANVYQVPIVVPTASSDLITEQGHEWVFRINAPSSSYANTALDLIRDTQSVTATMAIVFEETLFGESAAVEAALGAETRGIRLVAYESYTAQSGDYEAMMTRVGQADPDVIYFASNNLSDAKDLLAWCARLNINPQLYIGHAGGFVTSEFPAQAGMYGEYVIATSQWAPDVKWADANGENAAAFATRYAAEYARRCTEDAAFNSQFATWCQKRCIDAASCVPGMRAAQAYVALYVVQDALARAMAGSEWDFEDIEQMRLAVRSALRETNMAQTIFGRIAFDRTTGQNTHPVLLAQVRDGQFVTVYPQAYRAQDPVIPVPTWTEREQ